VKTSSINYSSQSAAIAATQVTEADSEAVVQDGEKDITIHTKAVATDNEASTYTSLHFTLELGVLVEKFNEQ